MPTTPYTCLSFYLLTISFKHCHSNRGGQRKRKIESPIYFTFGLFHSWCWLVVYMLRRPTYCHWMLYVFIKLQQFHPICCDTQPYSNPIVALMRLLTVSFFSYSLNHLQQLQIQLWCSNSLGWEQLVAVCVCVFFFGAVASNTYTHLQCASDSQTKRQTTHRTMPKTNKCTTD